MKPTSIRKNNLLCSVYWLDVTLIQKHPHRNIQNDSWPNIWAPQSPSQVHIKLTTIGTLIIFWSSFGSEQPSFPEVFLYLHTRAYSTHSWFGMLVSRWPTRLCTQSEQSSLMQPSICWQFLGSLAFRTAEVFFPSLCFFFFPPIVVGTSHICGRIWLLKFWSLQGDHFLTYVCYLVCVCVKV